MNKQKHIILIHGKRTTGKDTLALLIKSHYESQKLKVKSMAFAYATKVGYCTKYNIDLNKMLNDYTFKESHRAGLLNYFLTNENFEWYAEYVYKYIETENKQEHDNFDIFIIPDLRIKSHLNYFKQLMKSELFNAKYKCTFIHIEASEETKLKRGWIKKPCDSDFTETDLDDYNNFDIVIKNDSSIDDLNNNIKLKLMLDV